MAAAASARRAATRSCATAQEASRAISSSARLVRMIGTFAPSTMPARVRVGEERQALRQHVAGFQVGHDQHVGATGDGRR